MAFSSPSVAASFFLRTSFLFTSLRRETYFDLELICQRKVKYITSSGCSSPCGQPSYEIPGAKLPVAPLER